MKAIITLVCYVIFLGPPELSEVRQSYIGASGSKAGSDQLLKLLSDVTREDAKVLVAYKGAALALSGKYAPKETRKKNISEGIQLLEYAVEKEPNNLEIHLVRLSFQEHAPKILKYNQQITEDKDFILAHFGKQPAALKIFVRQYLKQSKAFTDKEKALLQ